jgi:hypothetical protein
MASCQTTSNANSQSTLRVDLFANGIPTVQVVKSGVSFGCVVPMLCHSEFIHTILPISKVAMSRGWSDRD